MAQDEGKHFFINGHFASCEELHFSVSSSRDDQQNELREILSQTGASCIRLFVAGAVTHVGKTSVCLGILAALRKAGLEPHELAYIKPATQCEAPDLLQKWCESEGIEHVSGERAPLVFYQGFTRSFLAGEQGTSTQWLERIANRIDGLAANRRVLIVDGVGFPAVGSIVGVDNADVAKAARAPVLLVCKSGVGAAIDSFNLNTCYFVSKGVPVLGAVFNFGDLEGFNSWDKCDENISLWFSKQDGKRERYYGVVPLAKDLDGLRERIKESRQDVLEELAELNARHFQRYVSVASIISDAAADAWCRKASRATNAAKLLPQTQLQPEAFKPVSREAVTEVARKAGAKVGG